MTMRQVVMMLAVVVNHLIASIACADGEKVVLGLVKPGTHLGYAIDEVNQSQYSTELFMAAARAAKLKFTGTYPTLDDNDEVAALNSRTMEFVGPVAIVESRMKHMQVSTPILVAKGAAFYRTGTARITKSEKLKGKRVGVAMWGSGHQWCLEREVPVLVSNSLDTALQDLVDGKLDVVITTQIAGTMALERLKLTKIEHAALEEGKIFRAYGFAALPENHALRLRIDEGLRLIRLSGEADRLYDKYVGPYQPRESAVSNAMAAWIGGLLLAGCGVGATGFVVTRKRLRRRSQDLQENQEHYRLITENLAGVTYRYLQHESGKRQMLSTNSLFPIWQEIFPQLQLENVFGEGSRNGVHPDDVNRLNAAVSASSASQSPMEVEFRLLDVHKTYHWIHARSFASKQALGIVWQGILLDVTYQRQLASSLHESEVKFQEIVEHCQDGILAINCPSGVVVQANSAAARALRLKSEELLGKSICILIPELKASIEAASPSAIETKVSYKPAPTETRELEVRIKSMEIGGRKAAVMVLRDVTVREQLAKERARIETEMTRTQKLEGLGVMAGGIAHDFNNILVGILGNLSLAQRQIESHSAAFETLKLVQRSADRAADLTSKLLAYSGGSATERAAFDLGKALLSSRDHLKVAAGNRSLLKLSAPDEQVVVHGDAVQIEQVLVNLVSNAAEAITHDNGLIEVSLLHVVLDGSRPDGLVGAANPPSGEYARLSVKDNGSGITSELMQKILEPFVTTKFAGRGLGLSAGMGIVRAHGGYLCIKSVPGAGSEFIAFLPLTHAHLNPQYEPGDVRIGDFKPLHRTVLVVDDEQMVRDTLRAMFKSISVAMLEAESGDAAIAAIKAGPVPDCVVLDITMPGKDGYKTLAEIRGFLPEIPVILCSGFTRSVQSPQFVADKKVSFLAKPYTIDELSSQIEKVTSKPASSPLPV